MYYLGVDIGAITAKAVLLREDRSFYHGIVISAGYNRKEAAEYLIRRILKDKHLTKEDIVSTGATGYGRKVVPFADRSLTEITCHAAGAHFCIPETQTIIDIGGQDSKGIRVDLHGRVLDFVMNDKCSAGTGRFFEVMANALETDLDSFGTLSLSANNPVSLSSTCTVFAESEVVGYLSSGKPREDIIAGLHRSTAKRIHSMIKTIGITDPVVMTGGVSKNTGMVKALKEALQREIIVPEKAQLAGAIGAAVLAPKGGYD